VTSTQPITEATPWHSRADELARWMFSRYVNRTNRRGGYYTDPNGRAKPVTYPTKGTQPGEVNLALVSRHFRAERAEDVVGFHTLSPGPNGAGLCATNDIDKHHDDEVSDPLRNLEFAMLAYERLVESGFRPLLWNSNGSGGYHLDTFFSSPIPGPLLHKFANWIAREHAEHGVPTVECFPKQPIAPVCGNWCRPIGRHHTRAYWPSVWNGSSWLRGDDAIDHVLSLTGDNPGLIPIDLPEVKPSRERPPCDKGSTRARPQGSNPGDPPTPRLKAWGEAALKKHVERCRNAGQGQKHKTNIVSAAAMGTFVPHCLSFDEVSDALFEATRLAGAVDLVGARKTIDEQIEWGMDYQVWPEGADYPKGPELNFGQSGDAIPPEQSSTAGWSDTPADALLTRTMATLRARPVRYHIPGRIAFAKVHLAAGRGGGGKSTFSRAMAADATRGRCSLGLSYDPTPPIDVLLVCGEDGAEDTILPGLAAEGADLERIHIESGMLIGGKKFGFQLAPDTIDLVRKKLLANPSIKLVIIDPIASYIGAKVNDSKSTELRAAVMDPLNALAEATGAAIIIVAHLNKGSGEAVDRIAGSTAYRDAVRAAYLVAPDKDDPTRRMLMPIKWNLPAFEISAIPFRQVELPEAVAVAILDSTQFSHLDASDRDAIRKQLRRVEYEPPISFDANDQMNAKRDGKDPNKVAKCAEWMTTFLAEFAYPSNEITDAAKNAGFTFNNVKVAKASLKDAGIRNSNRERLQGVWWSGFGDPRNWKLRPEPAPESPESPESFPNNSNTEESNESGECRETRECRETGESGETGGKPTVADWNGMVGDSDKAKVANKAKPKRKPKRGTDDHLLTDSRPAWLEEVCDHLRKFGPATLQFLGRVTVAVHSLLELAFPRSSGFDY